MHCTTDYPTKFEDVNLNALRTISKTFKCPIGYSDHTLGNEISIAALGMGCIYFEKHFTINKNMKGPDHKASITPDTFAEMVSQIRYCENMFGDGIKKVANLI